IIVQRVFVQSRPLFLIGIALLSLIKSAGLFLRVLVVWRSCQAITSGSKTSFQPKSRIRQARSRSSPYQKYSLSTRDPLTLESSSASFLKKGAAPSAANISEYLLNCPWSSSPWPIFITLRDLNILNPQVSMIFDGMIVPLESSYLYSLASRAPTLPSLSILSTALEIKSLSSITSTAMTRMYFPLECFNSSSWPGHIPMFSSLSARWNLENSAFRNSCAE